jgi:hypothetical protein
VLLVEEYNYHSALRSSKFCSESSLTNSLHQWLEQADYLLLQKFEEDFIEIKYHGHRHWILM